MADIRKRTGSKGTTYQVRYPSKATKSGYGFKTFLTLKEARAFRDSGEAKRIGSVSPGVGIVTVAAAAQAFVEGTVSEDCAELGLGSVWIQREFMTAAAILIMAAKL
jgi:hypothetical protein